MESRVIHVFSPVPVVTAPVDAAPNVRRARSGLSGQGQTPPADQGPRAQPAWGGTAPAPTHQPRCTRAAVKLTQAPGPHHVATTPKRELPGHEAQPDTLPPAPHRPPPPPASRLLSSWTRKLGLRPGFASRSQVSPRAWGCRPMQPLGWNSGHKSSVRGKGDRGTEGNLSTLLTFLPPPEVGRGPCPPGGRGSPGSPPMLPRSPHPQGPRKSGGDQSSQGPCARQGTVVLL